ncbi:ribosome maturation factor RimP [Pseudonocardia sp. RS010]|uniref:ribosome maturation factor RimP n=1 Tax=Pseudonocardia sp. RS010 TaxID=3385979 RepID=UPI0039A2A502
MPSPAPDQLTGTLRGVLEPVVADAGFELEDVEVRAAGRKHTVKVVVDVPEDAEETAVGLDAIARLSRSAAAELDRHEHLIAGSYTLEVTSPGIDRPLTRPLHWRRAHLRLARVTLAGGGSTDVRVGHAGPESVTVVEAGAKRPRPQELRYADVTRAVVQVEFKAPPKAEVEVLDGAARAEPGNEEQA